MIAAIAQVAVGADGGWLFAAVRKVRKHPEHKENGPELSLTPSICAWDRANSVTERNRGHVLGHTAAAVQRLSH